ncbi:MAG: cadmium-translocating P-type ATPase [Clostridium sp.]|nr:cadmium-translocating P-type ATPase [Clostridium sp.]MCM1443841.1 cadmium-translocating P-type ATPase [Candidatus Amulumruptor caecigallinarius]
MKKKGIKIICALILFLITLIFKFSNVWINNILYILSYLLTGLEILNKALRNILRGKVFDENFLMSVATLGAFGVGEFPEAVAVMLFYQIGEFFQSYAVKKSRKSITSLMDIRPDYANLYIDGYLRKVNPNEVKIGDVITVKPGEKIPLDGIVVEGNSSLDTKALTGEPVPRNTKVGDEVLSGCINLNAPIKIRVAKEFGESTVSKILNLVENASSKKSKSENFITKFAKYYTPIVVIIALIIAIGVPLVAKQSFPMWIYRGLSFLVVSCPCALVISIPLSFFGGIGGASKMGILIKGSNYLELLSKIDTVVFDKTGTLTKGVFLVQKIEPVGMDKEELLKLVAYAENYSSHPIATAIKATYAHDIDESKIKNVEELPGYGIMATINGHSIIVGNEKLMDENNIKFEKYYDSGTILNVAVDGKYKGYILISDEIKEDSKYTIKMLKKIGIKNTIMLTGDKKEVSTNVAHTLNIDKVYTELLPQDKVSRLEELITYGTGKIAFVGDGINDAPVLSLADIGIAMGGLGSDSAIEAADVVIMTDEPSKIVSAIKLSHKTMRIVKENIIFAISVKIMVLILAAFGIATMWEAVFADVGVSIISILNALRMLNVNGKLRMEEKYEN